MSTNPKELHANVRSIKAKAHEAGVAREEHGALSTIHIHNIKARTNAQLAGP